MVLRGAFGRSVSAADSKLPTERARADGVLLVEAARHDGISLGQRFGLISREVKACPRVPLTLHSGKPDLPGAFEGQGAQYPGKWAD